MKTLITLAIISALAAVAGSIIVGTTTFDGTVTEHPYEKGLLWDEVQREKATLGWTINIKNGEFVSGDNVLLVSVLDRDGAPLVNPAVSVTISRPSSSRHDNRLKTVKSQEGFYMMPVKFPLYGYWDVKINVIHGENNVMFTKRIFVEKGGINE